MDDMYRELIIENYKNPKNKGKLLLPDVVVEESNSLCGDSLEFFLKIKENILEDVSFEGKGCAISIASASLLSEHVKGMNIQDVKNLKRDDIFDLLGVEVSPGRNKCVMLALSVIKKGIGVFESENEKSQK